MCPGRLRPASQAASSSPLCVACSCPLKGSPCCQQPHPHPFGHKEFSAGRPPPRAGAFGMQMGAGGSPHGAPARVCWQHRAHPGEMGTPVATASPGPPQIPASVSLGEACRPPLLPEDSTSSFCKGYDPTKRGGRIPKASENFLLDGKPSIDLIFSKKNRANGKPPNPNQSPSLSPLDFRTG